MKIGLFSLLLLLVSLLAGGKGMGEECAQKVAEFEEKLEKTSHYNPPSHMENEMGTGMDMSKRGKRGEEQEEEEDVLAGCFSFNSTTEEVSVRCGSRDCLSHLDGLGQEFQELKGGECSGEIDPETEVIMEKLEDLRMCNQCVLTYVRFEKLEKEMKEEGCFPTQVEDPVCSPLCEAGVSQYLAYYSKMIEGLCRMNNPGGCGESGGITEGEIYDLLSLQFDEMTRIETALPLCSETCKDPVSSWYDSWNPLIENGCISGDGVDLSEIVIHLSLFHLALQCDPSCQEPLEEVAKGYYHLSEECRRGMIGEHGSEIMNSINPDRCAEGPGWNILGLENMAKGFFVISLLCLGMALIYLVFGYIYNRRRGKKGWQAVPSLFCCCSSSSPFSKKSKSPKNSQRKGGNSLEDSDDDQLVLFDADQEDRV